MFVAGSLFVSRGMRKTLTGHQQLCDARIGLSPQYFDEQPCSLVKADGSRVLLCRSPQNGMKLRGSLVVGAHDAWG